ncbi:hypothetical protein AAFC00_001284 [Neodothiora populina]|uniref:Uncharacterized protein n=1 Tax=Neodothiora populina TaxID=2781224 RepID=A0ABR3PNF2_9PEZI
MTSSNPAFHRLLSFFAVRSAHPNTTTITFLDSLRGDLSVGLNFPFALALALIRHIVFRNSGYFSIHVPTVRSTRKLLGGPGAFRIDEDRRYGALELVGAVNGAISKLDAFGVWALAADSQGRVSGRDVRLFQKGEIMEKLVERRRIGRANVLSPWRGGPIWVTGHSWAVKTFFDVDVYRNDIKDT